MTTALIGDPSVEASPAVYGWARCLGSTLAAGPACNAEAVPDPRYQRQAVVADGWAALPLAGPGVQACALADNAVELRARLERGERAAAALARAGGMTQPGWAGPSAPHASGAGAAPLPGGP